MKCLQGVEYEIPSSVLEWNVEGFEDFCDICRCGHCLVYVELGKVKFFDREKLENAQYDLANAILNEQLNQEEE